MLASRTLVRAMGAHDGLSAILAERAGFEALWAGGLGISTSHGLQDAGILTMTEFHADAVRIRRASSIPVIADVDAGFGDINVVRRMTRIYEQAGIDAVCIEDKQYPKRNSFREGHVLEDPHVFARKIEAIKSQQAKDDFVAIARLESLIAGKGMSDALDRARLYCRAGADAVLIHSRQSTVSEVREFCAHFCQEFPDIPVFVVPTMYYTMNGEELQRIGASGVIYANQMIRAAVAGMEHLLKSVAATGSTAEMEDRMASVNALFTLVDTDAVED
jgi:phosphoenolpyruvate phosphomutase